jgi:flagellar L-ring protein precursor FlgH
VKRLISFIAAAALLQACAGAPRQADQSADDFAPVLPEATLGQVAAGTVYNPAASFDLFMDLRARQVGDILTVMLVERTQASKESSTSTDKGTSIDTGTPVFMGKPITNSGNPLTNQFDSKNSFDGKADSSQSNRLDGSITVTVAGRLPNGNLVVRGEKQITINQGQEYVRLQGIVRPVDIGPQNTVLSTMIGDARITYSGKGALADANHPGWLARFFNSPWFPF